MPQEEYWQTADGSVIAVGEMTERHAKNCLRLMIRRMRVLREKATTEQRVLSEMAQEEIARREARVLATDDGALWPPRCVSKAHCDEQGWNCCMNPNA